MKKYYGLFFGLLSIFVNAQNYNIDSINKLKDEELLALFSKVSSKDPIKANKVIRLYLTRATKENDTLKMARAYGRLTIISNLQKKISFSDSIIELTKNLKNKDYPAIGYIIKGIEYYQVGNLKLAAENYLAAYKLAIKNKNASQQIFISDKLISLKSYWGNKQEALELQKKRHKLVTKKEYINEVKKSAIERGNVSFDNLYNESEIISMQNFVACYINLKNIDSASIYLEKGFFKIKKYKGYNKQYFYDWFVLASIEIDWYSKNYEKVIEVSNQLLTDLDKGNNKEILFDIYFFKGLSLIKSRKINEGIENLIKGDSIFEQKKIPLLPYHRDLFEELLAYYNSKNNTKMEIKYLNKLLVIDSIFKKNYQFFEPNLIKNYEIPQLIEEKEIQILDLEQKNKKSSITIWLIIFFLTVTLMTFILYYKRQQLYKKRFKSLMLQQELPNFKSSLSKNNKLELPTEITKDILKRLDSFEVKQKYLAQKISLQNMAKSFGTNPNYLSKVINSEKNKKFTNYLNDLRIEYAFKELKTNNKLRMYTVKAIANECGFGSAEHFSKFFYNRYGIYPSYYLKELKK